MTEKVPSIQERLIAGFSYLTGGIVGMFWLIACAFRQNFPRKFLMFNILQSIFVTLCYVLVNTVFWFTVNILSYIPLLNRIIRQLVYWFNMPYLFGYSAMQIIIYGTVLYLAVFSFMGVYAFLPWFSKIILSNFKD
jgi:hypothetical protein